MQKMSIYVGALAINIRHTIDLTIMWHGKEESRAHLKDREMNTIIPFSHS